MEIAKTWFWRLVVLVPVWWFIAHYTNPGV